MQAVNPSLTPAETRRASSRCAASATCSPHLQQQQAGERRLQLHARPGAPACSTPTARCKLASSPAVSIVPVDQVSAGSTVTLDGSASTGVGGSSIVGWSWTLVSGTPVSIQSADKPASVTLPAAGTWVFRLLVTDSGGRAADNTVTVTAVASEGSGSSGGGATGWPGPGPVGRGAGGLDAVAARSSRRAAAPGCSALKGWPA